jgi:hypothetical protein
MCIGMTMTVVSIKGKADRIVVVNEIIQPAFEIAICPEALI